METLPFGSNNIGLIKEYYAWCCKASSLKRIT